MKINKKELSIYVHIPFCIKKCLYCDFLSASADTAQIESYVKALLCEIEKESEKYKAYCVQTIFFGGGTPSVLKGSQIKRILQTLYRCYRISPGAEISMECNPATVTKRELKYLHESGINRLSIGLQSDKNELLKCLGRIHTYEDFEKTYTWARAAGFDNINIDLMSALPGQTLDDYKETLNHIISLQPEHISAYSLILEEGTAFYQKYQDKPDAVPALPDEVTEREMYYATKRLLKKAGYIRYEISNYAKKGFACRHNQVYWLRKEYVGFGLGAASLIDCHRMKNISDLKQYIERLTQPDSPIPVYETDDILSKQEQMEEFMFLGLRLMRGISKEAFKKQFSCELESIYGDVIQKLRREQLLIVRGDRITLSTRGIDISNYVFAEFLLD